MKITIGVVAYNEENNLPSLLRDIEAQSYPHADMEVVLADSMSTDDTRKGMQERCNSFTDSESLDGRKTFF